ncbi:non-ribosomal peptide synthetase [Williamsia soli]|uniref:non-ribosomal peptide synthetase n=1 Tax=Williamsia soli TaxID=364929 RepID=UPI001A9F2EA6|nr:non-ribosomal peptide synthetase [Williamsia soli]
MTTVRSAVARVAASAGDVVAVHSSASELTYRELDEQASRVTGYLRSRGVGHGDRVVVRMARGVDLFPVLLGVLGAGAAFVPIESTSTVERAAGIVRKCDAALVVTEAALLSDAIPNEAVVTLADMVGHAPTPAVPDSDRPAYVIFTSGTTGEPKGVVIGMTALHRYLEWARSEYRMDEGSGAPLFSSIAFDATLTTLFGPLLAGATIVVIGDDPMFELAETLRRRPDFSFVKATPHHVRLLTEMLEGESLVAAMRYLVVGGDELDTATVMRWMAICPVPVVNEYGPTETVVGCAAFTVLPGELSALGATVPIGRAIAGAQIHVLDEGGHSSATDEVGELFIGGPSADNAYFAQPGMTAARFVPDPFSDRGTRMYRSGDLASVRPDGIVEYHGRADRQIKVRGYRVELGEIEAAVRAASGVVDATAFAERNNGEVTTTVVYTGDADPGAIRRDLTARVPAWVVPHRILPSDVLPTTANAKADVAALVASMAPVSEPGNEPDALTVALVAEFAAVLPAGAIGSASDFYASGGDSMSSIRLVARLRRQGHAVTLADVPAHPTPQAFAALIAGRASAPEALPATKVGQEIALTPAQLDFFSLELPDPDHWNQIKVIAAPAGIEVGRLNDSLRTIVTRYDVLQYRFRDGRQFYTGGNPAVELREVDIIDRAALEEAIREANMGLGIEAGPLLRAVVTRTPNGPDHLVLVAHHLIIDEVSWYVLLDDLIAAYRDGTGSVAAAPAGFAQWRTDLARFADRPEVQTRRSFWDGVLASPAGTLPSDHEVDDYRHEHYFRDALDCESTADLRDAATAAKVGVHEVLLAALVDAVSVTFGIEPPRVDVESHGRIKVEGGVDPSRTIGWCTAVFPVVLTGETVVDLIGSAHSALGGQPWDGAEFGLLRLGEIAPSRSAEVLFNYMGGRDRKLDDAIGWALTEAPAGVQSPPAGRRPYALEFQSRILDGELGWELRGGSRHSSSIVRALSARIRESLATAIAELADDLTIRFADSGLSASELSAVMAQLSGPDCGTE